jgi:hypothetical protein
MKEYNLLWWEKQIIWNHRLVTVITDKDPLTLTIDDIQHKDFDVNWLDIIDEEYDDVIEITDIEIVDEDGQPIKSGEQ